MRAVWSSAFVLALVLCPASASAQDEAAGDPIELGEPVPPPDPGLHVSTAPPDALAIGELELRPALESRARAETRIDPPVGADDLSFVTLRNRVGLDARFRVVRALIQIQDARDFGAVDPTAASGITTDVHQGYLQLGQGETYLRVGRQEIDWGSQRLLGSLAWSSAARSFDAIRGRVRHELLTIDALASWVRASRAIVDPRTGAAARTEGDWLGGLSLALALDPMLRLTAYALFRHDGATEVPASMTDPAQMDGYLHRERNIVSPGLRLEGDPAAATRYELELVAQGGRAGGRDHVALGAAGEVHHRFTGVLLVPSIGGGASYGTGPSSTFRELDNFYPTNHARYGSADLIGLRNQIHGFVRAGIAPGGTNVELWADLHLLGLAEPGGRWSDAPGRTIAEDPTNAERFLGTEVDLELRWRPMTQVALWSGYAVFAPGAAASRLGRDRVTHWAYLMLGVTLP